MVRLGVAFGLVVCVAVGEGAVAFAQTPGQGPPMPIGMDLAKVPAGSWADYSMALGELPPMKMRIALAAKTPTGNSIETIVEGGMLAAAGKMVMHVILGPGADIPVKKVMMQMGSADPMELPVSMTGGKPFTKPNPKSAVGSETVKVPAGSFKAKHYREKTPEGDKVDYWVSQDVPPFGLVKVEIAQKNPQIPGKMIFLLTGMGKDAKPLVTKPPKPFDQAALMQQLGAASGGSGAGAGAGPAGGGTGAPRAGSGVAGAAAGAGAAKPAPAPAPQAAPKK